MTAVGPIGATGSVARSEQAQQADAYVAKAFERKLLEPYKDKLPTGPSLYLFALSLDPDFRSEERSQRAKEYLDDLDKEACDTFYYYMTREDSLSVATSILGIVPQSTVEGVLKSLFKFARHDPVEPLVQKWLQEVSQNQWAIDDKIDFVTKLFDTLPKQNADELIYHMRLHMTDEEFKAFRAICPKVVDDVTESLTTRPREYGQKLLKELEAAPQAVCLPYKTANERGYFLSWFLEDALDSPQSDLIATDFDEKDWQWLQQREEKILLASRGTPLREHAMNWMISIASRLGSEQLKQSSMIDYHDPHLWLFFHRTSKFVNREGSTAPTEGHYRELAQALTAENLYNYEEAFKGEFLARLIKCLVANDPKKFLVWLEIIIRRPDDYQTTTSSRMQELFQMIKGQNGLGAVVGVISAQTQAPTLQLTVFASSSDEVRKLLLQSMLADRAMGLQRLADWISLCVQNEMKVKPFVKTALPESLYRLLQEIDANLAHELKQKATEPLERVSDRDGLDFLDILLPVGIDLSDPVVRQQTALKKLRRHLRTPDIAYNDRRAFLGRLDEDLRRKLEREPFLEMLFHECEKEFWPLLFAFYGDDICDEHYMEYLEEKSRGGTFNKVKNKPQPQVETGSQDVVVVGTAFHWFDEMAVRVFQEGVQTAQYTSQPNIANVVQNVALWGTLSRIQKAFHRERKPAFSDRTKLISIAAETLRQMANSPHLQGKEGSAIASEALRNLYQATCETSTIYTVVERFIETATAEEFVDVMERFDAAAFRHNEEGFRRLVAESLNGANVEKPQVLAKCIQACISRPDNQRRGLASFKALLLSEPVLTSEEERGMVISHLRIEMGVQFLELFDDDTGTNHQMIKWLNALDSGYCKELFCELVSELIKNGCSSNRKLMRLQNLSSAYRAAGVDVIRLIMDESYKERREEIKTWYTPDRIRVYVANEREIDFALVRLLTPELLFSLVADRLALIVSIASQARHYYSLEGLFRSLDAIGCSESMLSRLFTEKKELIDTLKSCLEKELAEAMKCCVGKTLFGLITKLVPDWSSRLVKTAVAEVKEVKERAISYGHEPHFWELEHLLRRLHCHSVLDTWVKELPQDVQKDLQKTLEKVRQSSN